MARPKRTTSSCPETAPPVPDVPPVAVRALPCGDAPVPALPSPFVAPTPPTPARRNPIPPLARVTVGNPHIFVRCSEVPGLGPFGAPVTVPAGTLTIVVRPASAGLRDSQLRYLSKFPDLSRLAAEDLTLDELGTVFRFDPVQSAAWLEIATAARLEVTASAQILAESQLTCQFGNSVQTAACPEGSMLQTEFPLQPDGITALANPVTIAAGTVFGATQQEADEKAITLARQSLTCFFTNDSITKTCEDLGFPDPVPNDAEPLPSGARRVGSVTIAAGAEFSTLSKEDANERASLLAESLLSCFYVSARVEMTCAQADDLPEIGSPGLWDGVVQSATPVDATIGRGNPVFVPEGAFISLLSQASANQDAVTAALASLDCFWASGAVTKICESKPYIDIEGVTKLLPPSEQSPRKEVVLAVGAVTSSVSQADADQQANDLALFQLRCLYCNPEIPPFCAPSDLAQRPGYRVPVPASWVEADWSEDATLGVGFEAVCGDDPQFAYDVATKLGLIPAQKSTTGCRYGNQEIRVACVSGTNIIGKFPPEMTSVLDPRSFPSPVAENPTERYLIIAEGVVSVFAANDSDIPASIAPGQLLHKRATAYANFLAQQQGLALLDCFFSNDERVFTCLEDKGLADVAPESNDNVLVPAGRHVSYNSKEEATAAALAEGLSQLDCFYYNEPMEVRCFVGINSNPNARPTRGLTKPDGTVLFGDSKADNIYGSPQLETVSPLSRGHFNNPVLIPRKTRESRLSQEEANDLAMVIALATLDCFWTNPDVTVLCGAEISQVGDPGANHVYKGSDEYLAGLDPDATGIPGNPVTVTSGLFSSKISQVEAEKEAVRSALPLLSCFWTNDVNTVNCPAPVAGTHFHSSAIQTYTTAARLFQSFISKADANAQAAANTLIFLNCFYGNDEIVPSADDLKDCPGMRLYRPVLAADSVTGEDSPSVLQNAQLHFRSSGFCLDDEEGFKNMLNDAGGGSGEPGPAGAASPCSGSCTSFYA